MRRHSNFQSDILKERDHCEDLGVDGRIILIWILEKHHKRVWTGFHLV
jgi:hypothetical protein